MLVMTAKLSKTKLLAAGFILIAAIILVALLVSGNGEETPAEPPLGDTNDSRVAYLATFGWSVNAQPTETQQVKIPDTTENKVFARYNDLQISQGFDLTDYAGKEVTRYVYEILNYPDAKAPVYASVLIYDGHIIGGDITDSSSDGLIHGFRMPSSVKPQESAPETAPTEASTEAPAESSGEAE